MGNRVITIGRQSGSGGREVAKRLAERLGWAFYDQELLERAAEESGYSREFLKRQDEQPTNSFLYALAMNTCALGVPTANLSEQPIHHKVFQVQFDTIKKVAEESSCVIVGRCADYVLQGREGLLRVFLHADPDFRAKRMAEELHLSAPDARDYIRRTDRKRAGYYQYYTGKKWGDPASYDLCLNSGELGIDGCVETILHVLERRTAQV